MGREGEGKDLPAEARSEEAGDVVVFRQLPNLGVLFTALLLAAYGLFFFYGTLSSIFEFTFRSENLAAYLSAAVLGAVPLYFGVAILRSRREVLVDLGAGEVIETHRGLFGTKVTRHALSDYAALRIGDGTGPLALVLEGRAGPLALGDVSSAAEARHVAELLGMAAPGLPELED